MSQLNLIEEFLDFLDSPIWFQIVQLIKSDVTIRRRVLLTSTTASDGTRAGCIYALSTYRNLCQKIYEAAGRKLPPELLELFTGSPTE